MWRKHCIFPLKTLWIATNYFVQSLSFDHQYNFFFRHEILALSYLYFLKDVENVIIIIEYIKIIFFLFLKNYF